MAVGYAAGSSAGTSRYQRYVSSVHARSHFFSSSRVPFWSGYALFVNGSVPLRGVAHFAASCLQLAPPSPPQWTRTRLRTANRIGRIKRLLANPVATSRRASGAQRAIRRRRQRQSPLVSCPRASIVAGFPRGLRIEPDDE